MLLQELKELVKVIQSTKSESNYIELKAASDGAPKIYDTLSSFSNQPGGGVIVFGIDEKDYSVCGVYDAADLQKRIDEQALQMEPVVRPVCTMAEIDGKIVMSAEIAEMEVSLRPCFYRGKGRNQGSYVRTGDADRKMTEYEVYSYEAFRKKIQDELRNTDRAILKDIETDYLDDYLFKLKQIKPNLAQEKKEKQLRLQGFTNDNVPTLAGTLMFAEYPQAYYPRLCITAVVVPGTEVGEVGEKGERFIANETIEGTLPQMLNRALAFIRLNMKTATIIDSSTGKRTDKTEYPVLALREIILNAIIHRDYSVHTETAPITIKMFKDRIEVENPGGLYGRLTLDTLGHVSADTRNPYIAGAMEILNETENRFSGIPTIRREMREANLLPPVFDNTRGSFKVTLYNKSNNTEQTKDLKTQIVEFCNVPRGRYELANRFSSISKTYLFTDYVNPLVAEGALALTMPDKPRSKNQKFVTKQEYIK